MHSRQRHWKPGVRCRCLRLRLRQRPDGVTNTYAVLVRVCCCVQVRGIDPAPGDESARLPELPVALLDARYESVLRLTGRGEQQQQQQQQQDEEQRQAAA